MENRKEDRAPRPDKYVRVGRYPSDGVPPYRAILSRGGQGVCLLPDRAWFAKEEFVRRGRQT